MRLEAFDTKDLDFYRNCVIIIPTMTNTEFKSRLDELAKSGDIKGIITHYRENPKPIPQTDSKCNGECSLEYLDKLYNDKTLDNTKNRIAEGKSVSDTVPDHILRFIGGVSDCPAMLLSFIDEKDQTVLYIRDGGTHAKFLFGSHKRDIKLTGQEWLDMITEIMSKYTPDGDRNPFLFIISDWVEKLTDDELKDKSYSLHDVIVETKTQEYFNRFKMGFSISRFPTVAQHINDQQNLSFLTNTWTAHDAYMSWATAEDNYLTGLQGDRLLDELFLRCPGIGCKPDAGMVTDVLFRNWYKNAKLTDIEKPFFAIKSALMDAPSVDYLMQRHDYFCSHFNNHKDREIGGYWRKCYAKLGRELSFKQFGEFVELLKVINECDWKSYESAIYSRLTPVLKAAKIQSCKAVEDLEPWMDDFRLFVPTIILKLHETYRKALDRLPKKNVEGITNLLISGLIKGLDRKISVTDKDTDTTQDLPLVEAYVCSKGKTSWRHRFKDLVGPAVERVEAILKGEREAENTEKIQKDYQLDKLIEIARSNKLGMIHRGYSITGDTLLKFSFDPNESFKYFNSLHRVGRNTKMGNSAKKGIIVGFCEDNFHTDLKYADLTERWPQPCDYWKELAKVNTKHRQSKTHTDEEKEDLDRFILFCKQVSLSELDFGIDVE